LRRRHFDVLRPVCPVCRDLQSDQGFPLTIGTVCRERGDTILEGILLCTNPTCQREYPIIDGIPLIVPAIRSYVAEQLHAMLARADLSEPIESLIGDCCGPGSAHDTVRQQVSSYVWDHYGDLDPQECEDGAHPASVVRLLARGLAAAGERPAGPNLDLGCGAGRTSFELARACSDLVLGVDLNFALLRVAAGVLNEGRVRYGRRRLGVVYDRREFAASFPNPDLVDFWGCDATALPLPGATFGLAVSLNLLDSIQSPADHLKAIGRALVAGGKAVIACPYDWCAAATPIEGWLGGHSQRGLHRGDSEPVLRTLLDPGGPWVIEGLVLAAELDGLPWQVRLHSRSTMEYRVHLIVVEASRSGSVDPNSGARGS
jgi:SAM-dependent methyltransferase